MNLPGRRVAGAGFDLHGDGLGFLPRSPLGASCSIDRAVEVVRVEELLFLRPSLRREPNTEVRREGMVSSEGKCAIDQADVVGIA